MNKSFRPKPAPRKGGPSALVRALVYSLGLRAHLFREAGYELENAYSSTPKVLPWHFRLQPKDKAAGQSFVVQHFACWPGRASSPDLQDAHTRHRFLAHRAIAAIARCDWAPHRAQCPEGALSCQDAHRLPKIHLHIFVIGAYVILPTGITK